MATAGGQETGASEGDEPPLEMTDFLEVLEIDDDDSTGEGEGDGDDPVVGVVADSWGACIVCLD